jgi:hypothetical protein
MNSEVCHGQRPYPNERIKLIMFIGNGVSQPVQVYDNFIVKVFKNTFSRFISFHVILFAGTHQDGYQSYKGRKLSEYFEKSLGQFFIAGHSVFNFDETIPYKGNDP